MQGASTICTRPIPLFLCLLVRLHLPSLDRKSAHGHQQIESNRSRPALIRWRATPPHSECCTPSAPALHAGVERWRCGPNCYAQTHAASLALLFACKGAERAVWPARWRGRGTIPLLPGGALPGSRLVLVTVRSDYSRHPWLSALSSTRAATTSDKTQAWSWRRRQCLDRPPGRSGARTTTPAIAQPHADANAVLAEWIAYAVVIER
jgi:hypothetical protein